MYLNPINSAVDERKKRRCKPHFYDLHLLLFYISSSISDKTLSAISLISLPVMTVISVTHAFLYSYFVIQTFNSIYDNLLITTDLTDGITFHSTPQWFSPHLLSGKVLPDVQSCRLRDIFWHLPQMHLQSLQ